MVQARDIPDAVVLDGIRATRGQHGVPQWTTTWELLEWFDENVPERYPPKVILTKLASMVRRSVIGGHACSNSPPYCRGDFEIPGDTLPV